jgi:hypothetical protein
MQKNREFFGPNREYKHKNRGYQPLSSSGKPSICFLWSAHDQCPLLRAERLLIEKQTLCAN